MICYSCFFKDNRECTETCSHGWFGCAKVITYSGGIGSGGIQSEAPEYQVTTAKDCLLLPFGGAPGCREQISVGGLRVVTCYCNTDYCNAAVSSSLPALALIAAASLALANARL